MRPDKLPQIVWDRNISLHLALCLSCPRLIAIAAIKKHEQTRSADVLVTSKVGDHVKIDEASPFFLVNLCQHQNKENVISTIMKTMIMHQSFVAPSPSGPRNSGAFNFSIFKALLKALHCRAKFVVKSPLKAPALRGRQN